MSASRRVVLVVLTLAGAVGLDQGTKRAAVALLVPGDVHAWLGDTVRVQLAENRGAFLSLGALLPEAARFWLLIVAVGLLLAALLLYALLGRGLGPVDVVGLACFVGGGVSNWVDRLANDGRVVDFMNLGIGRLRTGIFNVADVVLLVGVGLMLLRRRGEGGGGEARGGAVGYCSKQ